jgi:hypothetical protein
MYDFKIREEILRLRQDIAGLMNMRNETDDPEKSERFRQIIERKQDQLKGLERARTCHGSQEQKTEIQK